VEFVFAAFFKAVEFVFTAFLKLWNVLLQLLANSLRSGIQWGACNPPAEQICGIDNDCTEHIPQIGLLI